MASASRNRELWTPRNRVWLLMLLPTLVTLFCVSIFPSLYTLYSSVSNWNFLKPNERSFAGPGNFLKLFREPLFLDAIKNTVTLVVGAVLAQLVLGFAVALLLERDLKGFRVIRTLILVPIMITPVVSALMWLLLYNTDFGILRYLVESLGVKAPLWLGDSRWALLSVALVDVWQWTPFVILLILAGLSSISKELYEAAKVDGANWTQTFFFVVLPSLKQVVLVVTLIRVMDTFKFFDPVYVLTKGGPGSSTETLSYFIYRQGFRYFEIGLASAASIIVLIIIVTMSRLMIRALQSSRDFE